MVVRSGLPILEKDGKSDERFVSIYILADIYSSRFTISQPQLIFLANMDMDTPVAGASAQFEELSISAHDQSMPYDDHGSLIIENLCDTLTTLQCASRLSGIGEVPELSEVQPVPHPAFSRAILNFISPSCLGSQLTRGNSVDTYPRPGHSCG